MPASRAKEQVILPLPWRKRREIEEINVSPAPLEFCGSKVDHLFDDLDRVVATGFEMIRKLDLEFAVLDRECKHEAVVDFSGFWHASAERKGFCGRGFLVIFRGHQRTLPKNDPIG